ncbi:MAG TPA: four helix bundle protein [Terriglobia bacterium]|nr:four helix bundle protein [Terriglobia bacterium]
MQDFKTLKVWGNGHELTLAVYKTTTRFPKEELYGLTSQIRRACASIPANIAEGCGKSGKAELGRYLQVAAGSASELQYHLLLGHDLGLIEDAEYKSLESRTVELKRMLYSFIDKLRS